MQVPVRYTYLASSCLQCTNSSLSRPVPLPSSPRCVTCMSVGSARECPTPPSTSWPSGSRWQLVLVHYECACMQNVWMNVIVVCIIGCVWCEWTWIVSMWKCPPSLAIVFLLCVSTLQDSSSRVDMVTGTSSSDLWLHEQEKILCSWVNILGLHNSKIMSSCNWAIWEADRYYRR